ncbi:hypothetical protein ACFX2J_025021 [Malus domestica]
MTVVVHVICGSGDGGVVDVPEDVVRGDGRVLVMVVVVVGYESGEGTWRRPSLRHFRIRGSTCTLRY